MEVAYVHTQIQILVSFVGLRTDPDNSGRYLAVVTSTAP